MIYVEDLHIQLAIYCMENRIYIQDIKLLLILLSHVLELNLYFREEESLVWILMLILMFQIVETQTLFILNWYVLFIICFGLYLVSSLQVCQRQSLMFNCLTPITQSMLCLHHMLLTHVQTLNRRLLIINIMYIFHKQNIYVFVHIVYFYCDILIIDLN